MKKVLMVSTIASTIAQFNMNNIHILNNMGYQVDVACDYTDREVWPLNKVEEFEEEVKCLGGKTYQINFSRNFLNLSAHIESLKQMYSLLKKEKYEFIHTHTPLASVITRIAAHKTNTKVIYTAHGFHFYKGAPVKNWILFFPVEWICSYWTDILITINREDYKRAEKMLHAKRVVYIPGVGIDTEKYKNGFVDRQIKRMELGIHDDDRLYLSVWELSSRKNHEAVIKAVAKMKNKKVKYVIAGKGELEEKLKTIISKEHLDGQVQLLGFRKDVPELCQAADFFIFPSLQEGLPVALMEAIACKTFVLCSNVRGNRELVKEPFMFHVGEKDSVLNCMEEVLKLDEKEKTKIINSTYKHLKIFSLETVNRKMKRIYEMIE